LLPLPSYQDIPVELAADDVVYWAATPFHGGSPFVLTRLAAADAIGFLKLKLLRSVGHSFVISCDLEEKCSCGRAKKTGQ